MVKYHHPQFGTHDSNTCFHAHHHQIQHDSLFFFLSFCNYTNWEEGWFLEIKVEIVIELEREEKGIEIENKNGEKWNYDKKKFCFHPIHWQKE